MENFIKNAQTINKLLSRYGVKFGIYKDGKFNEQLFPFDPIPRIIKNDEFKYLEKGLIQRVNALNCFLSDIYGKKQIVKDGIIPEEFIFSAKGYLAPCDGVVPPKNIFSHISGIDLVQAKDSTWYILEDNLRVPSGASYPMIARELQRKSAPETFEKYNLIDNRNYAVHLKEVMDYVNTGGINVILTPGRYNAAFFEHSFEAYKKGKVAILNAPGNGVADDKGIYYFVPKMIKYYLGEDAILKNAPTYLPFYKDDMKYVLDNFDNLVIKDVAEAGSYGVVFGSSLTKEKKADFIELLKNEPRRFIAQEVIDFYDIDIIDDDGSMVPRKADLRAFVLSNGNTKVWPSGLTRFSRNPDSFIVNSSQGGGFKDTWVLSH